MASDDFGGERFGSEGDGAPDAPARPKRRSVMRRLLIAVGAVLAVVLLVGATLYLFGGMERPSPDMRARYERLVADGSVAPIESVFVIPIPGCRCHSTDPIVTMEHSVRRIRECSACHAR